METTTLVKAFETELNLTEEGFKELNEKKKGLVIDVKTEAGFKLARKERTEQNGIVKDIDRLAIDGKAAVDEVGGQLKERVLKVFAPIVNAFEAEDLARKAKAKEKELAEVERVRKITEQIESIRQFSTGLVGKSSDDLQGIIEAVDMIDISENFAELTQEAMIVKKETLAELNQALSSTIQNEQLAIERESLRLERLAQEEKTRNNEIKAKAQERLNNLMMIPTTMFGKTSKEIQKKIDSIKGFEIKESEFGELQGQATTAVCNVESQLKAMFDNQVLVEKSQAKELARKESEAINQSDAIDDSLPTQTIKHEKPAEQKLAEIFTKEDPKIIPEQTRTHSRTVITPLTWHQKMIKQVDFWYSENGSYDDLMSILNQYK